VARLDQDQDSPQQILGEDVIFDVVGVMLNKEAQQL